PAKAPWYFMGFQELQLHFHPLFSVLIIPLLAVMGLVLIPYVTYDHDTSGVFMVSRKGRRLGLMAAITAVVVAPLWIVADEFWVDLGAWLTGTPAAISNGLLPAVILIAALGVFYALLKKRLAAANNEMIQAMFILLTVVFAVLTITGIWFRGLGMALTWPWGT
ncbi:MAG: cytochrome bc complex cytochrome b subunit, partial [Candidatus Krumholzibacteria bacterium]|nr:cytochrome bc complex cytochrome b subunit [Candidatus Krumholzibacteria bacterium]